MYSFEPEQKMLRQSNDTHTTYAAHDPDEEANFK
jgi:hypothetical protein